MKHNFIRNLLSVMLSCSVMILGCVNVSSEEYSALDSLEFYKHKFELLNEKYGTDFQIATFDMTEAELSDLLTGYLNMTDEEFEAYFLDMKEKCEQFLQAQSEGNIIYSKNENRSNDNTLRDISSDINNNDTTYKVYEHPNAAAKEIDVDNTEITSSPSVTEVQH